MSKIIGLFIFGHDLRLIDNKGLNAIADKCDSVYGVRLIKQSSHYNGHYNNHYNNHYNQFTYQQLKYMQLKGLIIINKRKDLYKLIKELNISLIYMNKDYVNDYVKDDDINITYVDDYYLQPLGSITTTTGHVYKKFTPFYNRVKNKRIDKPDLREIKLQICDIQTYNKSKILNDIVPYNHRKDAIKIMNNLVNYDKPTELSKYINLGVISIREAYYALTNREYHRQLYWRDLYANIMFAWPYVINGPYYEKYNKLPWSNNIQDFNNWRFGKTGIKLIDGAMRMLIQTGNMHNRLRLIVANYLVKTLFINWQWGEAHFAKYLIDYDLAINNGNWQWVASVGADAQPYFRTFNAYINDKELLDVIKEYLTDNEILYEPSKEEINAYKIRTKKNISLYAKIAASMKD